MSIPTRLVAGVAGLATVGALSAGFIASNASASGPDSPGVSHVAAGRAQASEWVVRLENGDGSNSRTCSGSAISADWVLTSRRCIDGARWLNAYRPDGSGDSGSGVQADRLLAAPSGDVALVHLTRPQPLERYAQLTDKAPAKSTRAVIAGYVVKGSKQRLAAPYSTGVTVVGSSRDAYGGSTVLVRGADGTVDRGDSGGPLVVDGAVVGIGSTGQNSRSASSYSLVGETRTWIRSTAGV